MAAKPGIFYLCNYDSNGGTFDGKFWISDNGELEESVPRRLRQRRTTGNGTVAHKTGNTYITGTMTNRIGVPPANLRFLNTMSWIKVYFSNFDNDQQLEWNYTSFGANLATSGCPLLSQSLAELSSSSSWS